MSGYQRRQATDTAAATPATTVPEPTERDAGHQDSAREESKPRPTSDLRPLQRPLSPQADQGLRSAQASERDYILGSFQVWHPQRKQQQQQWWQQFQ